MTLCPWYPQVSTGMAKACLDAICLWLLSGAAVGITSLPVCETCLSSLSGRLRMVGYSNVDVAHRPHDIARNGVVLPRTE